MDSILLEVVHAVKPSDNAYRTKTLAEHSSSGAPRLMRISAPLCESPKAMVAALASNPLEPKTLICEVDL